MSTEEELKGTVKRILVSGEVAYVIGYKRHLTLPRTVPAFLCTEADVDESVWNSLCNFNLSKYLLGVDKKVGLIAKGCDARAVVSLIQQNQLKRERVAIVGVSCPGMADLSKIRVLLGPNLDPALEVDMEGQEAVVRHLGQEHRFPKEKVLQDECVTCEYPTPVIYDYLVGEERPGYSGDPYRAVDEFLARPAAERWAFWEEQFKRCIRCFACQRVCPLCYCERCAFDVYDWLDRSANEVTNGIYLLTRALHVAGRCVDCGACERACPMNIPLRLLNKRAEKEVRERFGYLVGLRTDVPPPLASFDPADAEEFVR